QSVLGRGGMGEVYRATDLVLDRPVAIKVLSAPHLADEAFVARFQREARAAARLNHPGIVSVFDTGADGRVRYIVMELVEGPTLARVLAERGPLPPSEAAGVARQVAGALGYAHQHGVIHRDVKPGNVMLPASGEAKVMDFGI